MAAPAVRHTIMPGKNERSKLELLARALGTKTRPSKAVALIAAGKKVAIPTSVLEVLRRATNELAHGNGVTVLPVAAELTTEEAADVLNVSRPHVIKLTESGELPCHRVGTHRRIHLRDVLKYKRKYQERARADLGQLVDEAQDLDIYDK